MDNAELEVLDTSWGHHNPRDIRAWEYADDLSSDYSALVFDQGKAPHGGSGDTDSYHAKGLPGALGRELRRRQKTELVVMCHTVGELLDELTKVARDPNTRDLMNASLDDGQGGKIYSGFKIVRRTLGDKSEVLDFELF